MEDGLYMTDGLESIKPHLPTALDVLAAHYRDMGAVK